MKMLDILKTIQAVIKAKAGLTVYTALYYEDTRVARHLYHGLTSNHQEQEEREYEDLGNKDR